MFIRYKYLAHVNGTKFPSGAIPLKEQTEISQDGMDWYDLEWVFNIALRTSPWKLCNSESPSGLHCGGGKGHLGSHHAQAEIWGAAPEPARGEPGPVENTVDSVYHRFRMWLRREEPDSYVAVVWFGGVGVLLLICLLSLVWSKLDCTGLCAAWEMMK